MCVVYFFSQSYTFSFLTEQYGFFNIFDPSCKFSFHHWLYVFCICTTFKLHWTKCTWLKPETRWTNVFSFSSLFWKKKVKSSIFLICGKHFLLQSVVQSTSMFSSVPINVVSFFLLISANIVVWFLTKILTYCETQSLWLVLKNKFMLKPVICWLFHLYTFLIIA